MPEREGAIVILVICDEWKPSKGGLSAFNRQLVIDLVKESRGKFIVHCYVSQCDEADREDAKKNGVNLVTAQKIPGAANPHEWLKIPPPEIPNIDVVIGHGRKFGLPAYFIKKITQSCKLVQFLHVYCPDLGKYKTSKSTANCLPSDTIDENERKHADEIELCEVADAVVAVGPALQQKYQRDLLDIDVQVFTPSISASFLVNQPPRWQIHEAAEEPKDFICLVCGRADFEDRKLKGYDVIANAIGSLGMKFHLKYVGSPACKQRTLEKWFLKKTNITREQLTICRFVDQSQLKKLFCSSDVVVLPSRVEGFGLVALEAISADTNVLVSKQAGISQALQTVEGANWVIVESDDPVEWANKISHLSNQKVQERREKAIRLRENYAKKYSSQEECRKLLSSIETLVNRGDISQPSQSNRSPTQMPPQQNRKRARAEVDDQIRSIPMLVQAVLFQDFNRIFGKQTKIGSRCLRWGDVSLHRDPKTGSERLILKRGGSRACGGQGEHPLQPRAVKFYKIFEKRRPSEAKKVDSSFYLAVKPKVKNEDPVWYMNKPQAVNKIGKCQITRDKSAKRPRH